MLAAVDGCQRRAQPGVAHHGGKHRISATVSGGGQYALITGKQLRLAVITLR